MNDLDFKSAGAPWWSNEYLNVAIAMQLFLLVYRERPEAQPFRDKKLELEVKCLESVQDLPNFAAKLRKVFPSLGRFGASRKDTERTTAAFFWAMIPASVIAGIKWLFNPAAKIYLQDEVIRDVFSGYLRFCSRYKENYLDRSLGGTWTPKKISIASKVRSFIAGVKASTVLFDSRAVHILEYMRSIANLCYESGLKCWWAPIFLLERDLVRWVGPVPKQELCKPTVDGLLGPLFQRDITRPIIVSKGGIVVSEYKHHEYELIAMSDDEMRNYLGLKHSQDVHDYLEGLEYKHGNKVRQRDFDMLFDRLYLGRSTEEIAKSYCANDIAGKCPLDPSTVRRNTGRLARLLDLKIPRAKHSKQIEH